MKVKMKRVAGGLIFLLAVLFVQGNGLERYRLIRNPNPGEAASYREARYLKIQVNRRHRDPARIRILLDLAELFADEKIELEGKKEIHIGEIIDVLRDRGPSWMVELADLDDRETAWIWFER